MLDHMVSAYDGLELDGIWHDMNEATNFCDGYCIEEERPKNSLRNKPYYVPGERDLESESTVDTTTASMNMTTITRSHSCRRRRQLTGSSRRKAPYPTCCQDQTSKVCRNMLTIGWVTIGPGSNTWSPQSKTYTSISSLACHSWAVTSVDSTVTP